MRAFERLLRVLWVTVAAFAIPFVITVAVAQHLHPDPDTAIAYGFFLLVALVSLALIPVVFVFDMLRGLSAAAALRRARGLTGPAAVSFVGLIAVLWLLPAGARVAAVAAVVLMVFLYPEDEPDGIAFVDLMAPWREANGPAETDDDLERL